MYSPEDIEHCFNYQLSTHTSRVIGGINQEVEELGFCFTGTEHILLGLVREGRPLELTKENFTLESIRNEVISHYGAKGIHNRISLAYLTPSADSVMRSSIEYAIGKSDPFLEPEHMWVGLTSVKEGVAAKILQSNFGSLSNLESLLRYGKDIHNALAFIKEAEGHLKDPQNGSDYYKRYKGCLRDLKNNHRDYIVFQSK